MGICVDRNEMENDIITLIAKHDAGEEVTLLGTKIVRIKILEIQERPIHKVTESEKFVEALNTAFPVG